MHPKTQASSHLRVSGVVANQRSSPAAILKVLIIFAQRTHIVILHWAPKLCTWLFPTLIGPNQMPLRTSTVFSGATCFLCQKHAFLSYPASPHQLKCHLSLDISSLSCLRHVQKRTEGLGGEELSHPC